VGATPPTSFQKEFKNEFDRAEQTLRLTGGTRQIPADIEDWLGRLLLLYGVPFHYLVPEEDMLPPEWIRFFYLDPGWMKCLLEGACSVGRTSTVDDLVDQDLRDHFLDHAGKKAKELRAGRQGGLNWPLTGFLLRSRVVEGWQGLEMKASGVDGQGKPLDPIEALRIDRLNPEIMLCIFNGKVTEIEITQPPEDMHFGASASGANAYQKGRLRKLFPAGAAGDSITDQPSVSVADVPMRKGDVQRVVDIQALANQMQIALNTVKAIDGTAQGPFTSAEFAVQMVESPGKAIFTVKG
jgi:hypothetical protein